MPHLFRELEHRSTAFSGVDVRSPVLQGTFELGRRAKRRDKEMRGDISIGHSNDTKWFVHTTDMYDQQAIVVQGLETEGDAYVVSALLTAYVRTAIALNKRTQKEFERLSEEFDCLARAIKAATGKLPDHLLMWGNYVDAQKVTA
jgi:hypothetical protein